MDFTHQFVIEGKELTSVNTDQTINLITVAEHTMVDNVVIFRVDERITGPADPVSVEVGVASVPAYHITSSVVGGESGAGLGIVPGTLYGSVEIATSVGITDDNIYTCKFSGGGVANLGDTTNGGKVSIFMKIISTSDLGFGQS